MEESSKKPKYKYECPTASIGVTHEVRGKIKEVKRKNYSFKSASDVILWLLKFWGLNDKVEFTVSSENPHRETTIKFDKLPEYLNLGWKLAGYRLISDSSPLFEEEK